jgi:hypothetical protein
VTAEADPAAPVAVQTRFDRFPATIKGALVLRGADSYPHHVRLASADIVRLPDEAAKPVPFGDLIVNVAPARDLFLPFEAPISDLEPGWYVVRSEIQVDGGRSFVNQGRAFSIPWPRVEVRTGTVKVDAASNVAGRECQVDRIEMKADRTIVVWHEPHAAAPAPGSDDADQPAPPPRTEATLSADGRALPPVPAETGRDATGDERRATFYPVPKAAQKLRLTLRSPGQGEAKPIDVALT